MRERDSAARRRLSTLGAAIHHEQRAANFILLLGALCIAGGGRARGDDGGPDHYQVKGVSSGSFLILRAKPDARSEALARIPANAQCLRNMGCQGGLTFQEYQTLSEDEKKKRQEANPRWCKVEYKGKTGWVLGSYVTEGYCPAAADKR